MLHPMKQDFTTFYIAMFIRKVFGKSTKMSWFEYVFLHLIPTSIRSVNDNFVMWRDLITGDYEKYTLSENDDPFQECYLWFWSSINLDETCPKEFLEYLNQISEQVERGEIECVPFTQEMLDEITELVDDINEKPT